MSNFAGLPTVKTDVTQNHEKRLMGAKIALMRGFPFLGFLVMSTEFFFTDDIPTACATTIGGNKVYFSPKYADSLNDKQLSFEVAHEVCHIFFEHVGRCKERNYNHQLFNLAADFVNDILLIETHSSFLEPPPIHRYNADWSGKSADEIYFLLLKQGGGNPGKALSKYGIPSDEAGDLIPGEAVSGSTKAANKQKISASLANTKGMRDHSKSMGTGAENLLRKFQELLEVKLPWKSLLAEFITASSRQRYTYTRISRRSTAEVLFPSLTGDSIHLAFAVDTSGSMSQKDLAEALTELSGIVENFDSWQLSLLSGDTEAHLIGEYTSDEGDDFTSINKDLIGFGGTDMNIFPNYVNDMEEPPSVLIIVTDGYIPPIENIEEVPTIVVVTSDGAENIDELVPNGHVIYMKEN